MPIARLAHGLHTFRRHVPQNGQLRATKKIPAGRDGIVVFDAFRFVPNVPLLRVGRR
jgi:hypothetical protein